MPSRFANSHKPSMERDPFIAGLEAYFSADPARKPATVSRAAGLSPAAIRKMLENPKASCKMSSALAIARAIGSSIEDVAALADGEKERLIPVVGTVGAGARVPVFEAYEPGDGPAVPCPPGLSPGGKVAVRVAGDSMEPVYSDGDLLFYTRRFAEGVATELLGRRCVCEDQNGDGWVKQIKPGSAPGLFNLISLNPGAMNQHDVRLKWAAEVLLHWPARLAAAQPL